MATYLVKAAPPREQTNLLIFHEKTMWGGKTIGAGDEVFIFAAEHNGGHGLYARGVVIHAVRGIGSRVNLTVTQTSVAIRRLGRSELRPFRDQINVAPQTEIDWKLYRQATNKIAGLSDAAAAFLKTFF